MWRSGGIRPEPVSPRSRFSGLYRVLLTLAVLIVIVVLIFPILLKPGAELPTDVQFKSPFSVTLQISNQNFTPLTDVEYNCEVSKLTLANGSAVTDAKVLDRGTIRKIRGRQAITARCETAYLLNPPVKAVEYKLTLTYRTYPWPQRRTRVYRIVAQINSNGQLTGWTLN
jgi:hypothetical protein